MCRSDWNGKTLTARSHIGAAKFATPSSAQVTGTLNRGRITFESKSIRCSEQWSHSKNECFQCLAGGSGRRWRRVVVEECDAGGETVDEIATADWSKFPTGEKASKSCGTANFLDSTRVDVRLAEEV